MSARDKLIELFDAGGPHHLFSSEEVAVSILALHAHELAEQVREAEPYVPESFSLRPEWLDAWNSAKAELADKIDPEVEE